MKTTRARNGSIEPATRLDELVAAAASGEGRRHPGLVAAALHVPSCQRAAVGVGHAWLPDGPVPAANTLFEIGSITTVFTGLLLAIAVVRGEVTLDTPAHAILPGLDALPNRDAAQITLEHLATHRSGLPRSPVGLLTEARAVLVHGTNPYQEWTPDRVLKAVAAARLRHAPGSGRITYSNLGTGVLGLALVAAAGARTYAELVRTRICAPLDLTDTTVLEDVDGLPLATGYRGRGRRVDHWSLSGLAGAGALLSSGRDMLTLLAAQLQPESTTLTEAIVLSQQERHRTRRFAIALGWVVTGRPGDPILWHNGATGGFRSFAGFAPRRQGAVVLLTNSRRAPEPAALRLLSRLGAALPGSSGASSSSPVR